MQYMTFLLAALIFSGSAAALRLQHLNLSLCSHAHCMKECC